MSQNFSNVLPLVLAHEGGYVNHPADPGGATMKGITQAVYDAYRDNRGQQRRSVKDVTRAELHDIYKRQYWDMVDGDELPAGVDYACFDYAVNSGANRAVKDLQRTLKAMVDPALGVDGQVGQNTIRAANRAADLDEVRLIELYCNRRMSFLRGLKTWGTFGKGWKRRVIGDMDGAQITGDMGVIDYATRMAKEDLAFPIPKTQLPTAIGAKEGEEAGKGEEGSVAVTRTKPGIGAIVGATGVTGQTVITAAEQVKPHIGDSLIGKVALVVFLIMMVGGAALLGYTFYQRMREKGAI